MKLFQSLLLLFALSPLCSNAQQGTEEYIADLDPQTAAHVHATASLGPMSVLANTAYDQEHHHFFFTSRINPSWIYYTIDMQSGAIVHQVSVQSSSSQWFAGAAYDNSSDTLYGIYANGATIPGTYSFAWLDPATGSITLKSTIANINFTDGYQTGLDEINHRYFFIGTDANFVVRLYMLDCYTGALINSYPVPNLVKDMQFSSAEQRLYCLTDSTWPQTMVDTVDLNTGIFHHAFPLDRRYGFQGRETSALNEATGMYTFVGSTYDPLISALRDSLYTIDLQNMTIVHRAEHLFEGGSSFSSDPNMIGYQYDDSLNRLFTLHWGNESDPLHIADQSGADQLSFFPNPSTAATTLLMTELNREIALEIYSAHGQLMLTQSSFNTDRVEINTAGLPAGIYFVSVTADGIHRGTQKLIVE